MKTYFIIKKMLERYPETRDSDKILQWKVWEYQGAVKNGFLNYNDWLHKAKISETLRRTRQKIQERYPSLRSSAEFEKLKEDKESTKGTWIFRDDINTAIYSPIKNS